MGGTLYVNTALPHDLLEQETHSRTFGQRHRLTRDHARLVLRVHSYRLDAGSSSVCCVCASAYEDGLGGGVKCVSLRVSEISTRALMMCVRASNGFTGVMRGTHIQNTHAHQSNVPLK